jgi:hypothetical protein
MPPVIDSLNDDHVEAHTLDRERPQGRGAPPGFWCSLAHGIATYPTPTPPARHAPSYRPFEAPMDRLVQESASLSLLALAIV